MSKERAPQPQRFTLEEVVRMARETALRDGGHAPIIIVDGSRKSTVGQLADLPEAFEDKERLMYSIGFKLGQTGNLGELEQVFFISEGWMSIRSDDRPPVMPPSQDPQRKEVLSIFQLVVPEQRTQLVGLEMIRSTEGRLMALRSLLQLDEERGHAESPLLEAFVEGFQSGKSGLN